MPMKTIIVLFGVVVLAYISPDLNQQKVKMEKKGNVIYFYEEKEDSLVYSGCATLEDTTITKEEAKKAFFSKDTTDSPIFFDMEKGMIKRKTPQD